LFGAAAHTRFIPLQSHSVDRHFQWHFTFQAVPKMDKVLTIMNEIYGAYTGPGWVPKPYGDNKSRYLWTDAFGVCNYISMYYESGNKQYLDQADTLIQNVHDVLGKDRAGQKRLGNSTDAEPLKGGLRIGKIHEEDHPDGDGQYYHYLVKWMFALSRMTIARNDPKYNNWAIQLAQATHNKFVYDRETKHPRMWWKMNIDLTAPAKLSEGQLDPYSGYMTYKILREVANNYDVLEQELSDMIKMVEHRFRHYKGSQDPLTLGSALWMSSWFPDEYWALQLTEFSMESLSEMWKSGYFKEPSKYRLAFREFGTSLGLQTHPAVGKEWQSVVKDIHNYWDKNLYHRDHDITPIMYCSSLLPGVFDKRYPMSMGTATTTFSPK